MKPVNPISLGQLQDNLTKQDAKVYALRLAEAQALSKLRAAERAFDLAKQKHQEGIKALDACRQAVLSAARTVANG